MSSRIHCQEFFTPISSALSLQPHPPQNPEGVLEQTLSIHTGDIRRQTDRLEVV